MRALRAAGAASIRLIDVSALDLPPKGDAVDWLATHPKATADDVLKLPRIEAPTPKAALTGTRTANVRRMADIQPEPIRWLWPGKVPQGKLTVLSSDPGVGKSLVTIAITAHVTKGAPWPVDRSPCPTGDVVLLSAEDDPADTVRPRLDAAGADVSRVHVLESISEVTKYGGPAERSVSLRQDLDVIEGTIAGLPDCKLVVIDPVSAFLESADSYKDAAVRGFLAPIAKLAARCKVAVVVVMHLTKSRSSNPLSNVNGSIGFVAASRAAFVVTKDKDNETRRLVLPLKNNLGPDTSGVAYKVVVAENGAPTVEWEPDPVNVTARDALAVEVDDGRSERGQAADWLREMLEADRMKVDDLKREAKAAGHSWRTVERAKAALGVKPVKDGYQGAWYWELPSKAATELKDRHVSGMAAFGDRGGLWGGEGESESPQSGDAAAIEGRETGVI